MPGADAVDAARLVVASASGEEAARFALDPGAARGPGGAVAHFALPALADGEWRAGVRLDAGACRDLAGPETRFTRKRFGWEGNALGRAPVIPPFTPLTLAGRRVGAVLREHALGEAGLFDQVVSDGEPLLAAPMRLDVVVDGAPAPLGVAAPLGLARNGEVGVEARARANAGPLRLELSGAFEVDGLYRVELAVDGPPGARVDRFDLVIPLREARATLLNGITDGTQHHALGELPAGTGRVWDSSRVGRVYLPRGFVPYVWVGDEERGLAWMTDTGRDLWFVPGTPLAEVRRAGGAVELVIHFAGAPGPLARARRIAFALQATPVKPRPPDWRRWQLSCEAPPGSVRVCPLAAGWYWGSASPYGHYYPRDHDESFLRRLGELRRGGRLGPLAGDAWLASHGADGERHAKMQRDSLRFAVTMLGRPQDAVVAYVNAHDTAATPEFAVYGDEWRPAPFGDREGDDESGDQELDVIPGPSFRDYALWHLDRLLATGAVDGFFFDNTFLRASFDERHGSAWRDERGELQPGVDLFEVRELLRRAQTLVWERRGHWWNVAHATTTPISAIQGWAGFLLDGEWRYGAEPHTRRFPRDLVRASSLGSQLGAVPVYLPGITGVAKEREAALRRSLAGFTALHEIRVMDNLLGAPGEFARRLLAFGYGDPACSVHHYWDRPPAFDVTGADAEALVVRCGDDALALVVGFGEGGRAELRLDPARFGDGRCSDPEGLGAVETRADGCSLTLVRDDVRWIAWHGGRR